MSREMVISKTYDAPLVDKAEILRYAGVRGEADGDIIALLDECLALAKDKLRYDTCFCEVNVSISGDEVHLGNIAVCSHSLSRALCDCDRAVVFAASVGLEIDRLIVRQSAISPARALLLEAIGNERVESLCDALCSDIAAEKMRYGYKTRPRFSAGYGDMPLAAQKDIFALLDCQKRIGVSLNQSLLMTPSKSVTAIIGIYK